MFVCVCVCGVLVCVYEFVWSVSLCCESHMKDEKLIHFIMTNSASLVRVLDERFFRLFFQQE